MNRLTDLFLCKVKTKWTAAPESAQSKWQRWSVETKLIDPTGKWPSALGRNVHWQRSSFVQRLGPECRFNELVRGKRNIPLLRVAGSCSNDNWSRLLFAPSQLFAGYSNDDIQSFMVQSVQEEERTYEKEEDDGISIVILILAWHMRSPLLWTQVTSNNFVSVARSATDRLSFRLFSFFFSRFISSWSII